MNAIKSMDFSFFWKKSQIIKSFFKSSELFTKSSELFTTLSLQKIIKFCFISLSYRVNVLFEVFGCVVICVYVNIDGKWYIIEKEDFQAICALFCYYISLCCRWGLYQSLNTIKKYATNKIVLWEQIYSLHNNIFWV